MLQQTHFSWKRISVKQAKTKSYVGMCARESGIRVGFEWIICLNLFQAVQSPQMSESETPEMNDLTYFQGIACQRVFTIPSQGM